MTHDEQDRPTWDGDAIAEALGRELARRDDSRLWADEAFLEWLGADRRAHADRRARRTDDDDAMHRAGRDLRARLLARRSDVGLVSGPPRFIAPTRHGLPAEVMDTAAAIGTAPCVELAAAAGAGRAIWDEPAEQWVVLPDGTPRMRALALRIAGESMAPLIRSGDTVLVDVGPIVARGRLVVARGPDGYVCKRVERIGRHEVLLASLDPAFGTVTIPRDDRLIVGTVRMVWRGSASGGGN